MKIDIVVDEPKRILIKPSEKATDYFSYCEEVGCEVWDELKGLSPTHEPQSLWLPKGTLNDVVNNYVMGIETIETLDGYEWLDLSEITYMKFQGEPYDDEYYQEAISQVRQFIETFDPSVLGYEYKVDGYRIQLEPIGQRGYIELIEVIKEQP